MKNVIIVLLLAATVVLGGLYIRSNGKIAQTDTKLIAQEKVIADLEGEIAQRDERAASLRAKLEQTQEESVVNAGAAAQLSQALTNQVQAHAAEAGTNAKPANPFAEMFKNPEMRDMIKNQQKTVLGGMVDKNYAEFFKSMNLTPEQSAAMKDLIMNKMLGNAELGMEMIGGEMDAEKRAALTKQMKENTEALNEQIKALLGAENYSLYETYEKTIPDRMAVSQFKDQLGSDQTINAEQERQLIEIISSERQGFKFTTDFNDQSDFSGDMMSRFTEERINLFLQEQEQLNQRYLARAQPILNADQYTAYQKSLNSQLEMTKMGMKMAASMFGTKK
jgi:hypothetical protein